MGPVDVARETPGILQTLDLRWAREYHSQWAAFEVPPGSAPVANQEPIRKLARRMKLRAVSGLTLELSLGKLRSRLGDSVTSELFTDSRYRLRGPGGLVLAEAESTLSTEDLTPDADASVQTFFDPATGSLLVAEQECWSTRRFILFKPGDNQGAWRVRYLIVPEPRHSAPPLITTCLGYSRGLLYFETRGVLPRVYAVPPDKLPEETDLTFGRG